LINDATRVERAEIVRQKGTDRSRLLRGQVDKYTWVDIGSSYSVSDLLAAFLFAQLQQREPIQSARRRIWERYNAELRAWGGANGVRLPVVPPDCEQPYHIFYLLLPSLEARQRLIAHLAAQGILAVFHYLPLNVSRMGERFGGRLGDCPVTEDVSMRLLRLPFFNDLTNEEQSDVIGAICSCEC
jgi:dTDP-4-amino-4,6-dideoxygalactose transaminase